MNRKPPFSPEAAAATTQAVEVSLATQAAADERIRIGNTPTTTEDVQKLLDAAAEAQTVYWDALRELEEELAALTGEDINLDDVGDLAGLTVDDVIESFGPNGLGGVDAN